MARVRDSKGRFAKVSDSLAQMTESMAASSAYVDSPLYGLSGYAKDVGRSVYKQSWIAKMAVEGVPEDAFKKGYTWVAEAEQISAIEAVERAHKVKDKKKRALILANLEGEAYIYFDIGDDPSKPIDLRRVGVGSLKFVNIFGRNQIIRGPIVKDPMSPLYEQPEYYSVSGQSGTRYIHPSRICRVVSNPDPVSGEGRSVMDYMLQPISDAETARSNTVALTTEALIDIISVEGLMDQVSTPQGAADVVRRYELFRQGKATNKLGVLDSCETFERHPSTFTTLPEIIETMRREVAAAMKRPYALIWGRAGGLGTNGDMELKSYYDEVATVQRTEIQPVFETLDEVVIRSALGNRPEEIYMDWPSLYEITDKEKAEISKLIADTAKSLMDIVPAEVLTEPVINSLTEIGTFQGIEQSYSDWSGDVAMEEDDGAL